MSDILKKMEERRNARILKEGKSLRESQIICPYCVEEISTIELAEVIPNRVDEWEKIECLYCDKEFQLMWEPTFSTETLESFEGDSE